MQSALTSQEFEENEARKGQLLNLVASGEAILFVGAGSSARLHYATWSKLLETLEEIAAGCSGNFVADPSRRNNNPLEYAKHVKDAIVAATGSADRYYNCLMQLYGDREPQYDDFHTALVLLPFKGIITTNYDPILDMALLASNDRFSGDPWVIVDKGAARSISQVILAFDDTSYSRRVVHLHGRFNDPSSLILTSGDYLAAYGISPTHSLTSNQPLEPKWTLHRKLLWSLLATRRVVFIGFSMADPYLKLMLELVGNDLWRWEQSIHFAIMATRRDDSDSMRNIRMEYRGKFGLDIVFYDDEARDHRGLDTIVSEMMQRCDIDLSRRIIDVDREYDSGAGRQQSVTQPRPVETQEQSVGIDWLTRNNRKFINRILSRGA